MQKIEVGDYCFIKKEVYSPIPGKTRTIWVVLAEVTYENNLEFRVLPLNLLFMLKYKEDAGIILPVWALERLGNPEKDKILVEILFK